MNLTEKFEAYERDIIIGLQLAECYAQFLGCRTSDVRSSLSPSVDYWNDDFATVVKAKAAHFPSIIERGGAIIGGIECRVHTTKDNKILPFALSQSGEERYLICKEEDFSELENAVAAFRKAIIKALPEPPKVFIEQSILDRILEATVDYISFANKYDITTSRGVILYGPPGNGKSMIARWLRFMAERKGVYCNTFVAGNAADVLMVNRPSINIIDDVDISMLDRKGQSSKFANTLLSVMDGVGNFPRSFVLTSNEDVGKIPEAFLRPGRFDMAIKIKKPDRNRRLEYINSLNLPIDAEQLADKSEDFSFAELNYIKNLLLLQKYRKGTMNLDDTLAEYKTRLEWKKEYETI